jgi:hypothetical protein
MIELVYIDEQPEQRHAIHRAAALSNFFDQNAVVTLHPSPTLTETIAAIEDLDCKVLISDYMLSEYAPDVTFLGTELVAKYQELHLGFPCFVTTSFAQDAADKLSDLDLIYTKSEVLDTTQPLPFFRRVRKKIEEYDRKIGGYSIRHADLLLKLRTGKITGPETNELLDIDGMLERMLHAESAMTPDLKRLAMKPMSDLISKTEELIADIKMELKQNNSGR